jgi:hypothetical protein
MGIGTFVMTFLRLAAGKAWSRRQTIMGWAALALTILLMLEAIRFNTVSANESTIASLLGSVDRLNEALEPRHLSAAQAKCLKAKLLIKPGTVRFAWAGANAEAFQYASELDDVVEAGNWRVLADENMLYPDWGVWIFVSKIQVPPDAVLFRDALSACQITAGWKIAPDISRISFGFI